MVIVSGGFLTETLRFELSQITDRALRAGVIINAMDARGLWTDPTLDASQGGFADTPNAASHGQKHMMLMESARRQTDGMQALALDTGGVFFNNNNDLEAGFRKAAGLPEAYYLLAFSPQNLKLDGTFHPIQVKLVALKGLAVQARRGYLRSQEARRPDRAGEGRNSRSGLLPGRDARASHRRPHPIFHEDGVRRANYRPDAH